MPRLSFSSILQALSPAPLLDKAIAAISPSWALSRLNSRIAYTHKLATYEAATKDRTTSGFNKGSRSADQSIIPDGETLNARARQSLCNDWAAVAAQDAWRRQVIGTGIIPRANATDPDNNPLSEFNKAKDELFLDWANNPDLCDIEARKTFWEMQELDINEWFAVGESFTIFAADPSRENHVPLVLQYAEPEQLDLTRDRDRGPRDTTEIRGGVEVNAYGRALAYWFFLNSHPLEHAGDQSGRVKADRVLHFFSVQRVRQTRGVTRMHAILRKLRDLMDADNYELLARQGEACIMAQIITNNDAQGDGLLGLPRAGGQQLKDSNGNVISYLEPQLIVDPGEGRKVELLDPVRPGANYDPYITRQLRMTFAGAGLSYDAGARDAQGSFSSARQNMLGDWASTDPIQKAWVLKKGNRIRQRFTDLAVRLGLIDKKFVPDGYFDNPIVRMHALKERWTGPAKLWVDPAKQAAAALIARKLGIETLADQCDNASKDWRDQLETRKETTDYAEELDIELWPESEPLAGGMPDEASGSAPKVRAPGAQNSEKKPKLASVTDRFAEELVLEALRESEIPPRNGSHR